MLKIWQLLHTYWLPNSYWNGQEYVVSAMLISVLNINVTCEWPKAIKLIYKNSLTNVVIGLMIPNTLQCACISSSNEVYCLIAFGVARAPQASRLGVTLTDCAFSYKQGRPLPMGQPGKSEQLAPPPPPKYIKICKKKMRSFAILWQQRVYWTNGGYIARLDV
jgi:hypothetical protein